MPFRLLDVRGGAAGNGNTNLGTIHEPVTEAGTYTLELGTPGPDGRPSGGSHQVRSRPRSAGQRDPQIVEIDGPPVIEIRRVSVDFAPRQ